MSRKIVLVLTAMVACLWTTPAAAQPPGQGRGAAQGPTVISPEVGGDRRVTFRILATAAQKVELRSPGDIPGIGGRGVAPP